jgi:hypothetical protein
MIKELRTLRANGMTVAEVEEVLENMPYSGFPIVSDADSVLGHGKKVLQGYIGRTELKFVVGESDCFLARFGVSSPLFREVQAKSSDLARRA